MLILHLEIYVANPGMPSRDVFHLEISSQKFLWMRCDLSIKISSHLEMIIPDNIPRCDLEMLIPDNISRCDLEMMSPGNDLGLHLEMMISYFIPR